MKSKLTRRSFLKRSVLAAGTASAAHYLAFPAILSARQPSDTLNIVQIGCGGRGETHLNEAIIKQRQHLVALVDPDDRQIARKKKEFVAKGIQVDQVQAFSDYREMFDKIGKQIDAVFVAAPNHHHCNAALMALEAGKNVYCEKPLTHDIAEARKLREASLRYNKVATQMGNQGHCGEGYRRLCEFVWAGVIGNITETHSWTDRANGGIGPRPPTLPVPPGMHWDSWIGPAPYRDYHSDLHPHEWHGWYDFGNGSIGNMGCHVLEGVYWALKVEHPTSVEMEYVRGGTDQRYPLGSRVRWDIPARGDMPPVKAYWYEGMNPTTQAKAGGNDEMHGQARNLPKLAIELQKQYPDEELLSGDSGTLYVGEKGVIFTATYGGTVTNPMHIVPIEKMDQITQPPRTLPRIKSESPFINFIETCKAGRTDTATPFEYGARLTEYCLLGNLAQHAGEGNKVMWDGPNMRVTNIPELNRWVKREDRKGWVV
ncbi:MAG TPA: Gfo/Idh/MocA family oxidoreductase [Verrucomicrobiae bacterium]|jgi:predicted dehydrogenase